MNIQHHFTGNKNRLIHKPKRVQITPRLLSQFTEKLVMLVEDFPGHFSGNLGIKVADRIAVHTGRN